MTRGRVALGLVVFFALAMAVAPSSVVGFGYTGTGRGPYVKEVNCSVTSTKVTHRFFPDGTAIYGTDGDCQVKKSNGETKTVRYHVDGGWTPGPKAFATETGRIYDLGIVAPELFQPGPPGHYTTFIIRLSCTADPWLNDAQCRREYASGVDELGRLFPRISRGPFPLTKGAINAATRARLRIEYKRATGQFVGPPIATAVRKTAPAFAAKKQAPYGAGYGAGPIPSLTRGQTTTVKVSVVNTGSLTWTPSGANAFRLSYHWYRANSVGAGTAPPALAVVWDGLRTNLPGPLGPNETNLSPLNASVQAPSTAGTYVLKWDMVQEGFPVTWFSQRKVLTFDQTVVVK
ncbi:MAG: hypothetical protein HYY12_00215 [Candidatus Methylomirabilis oxyfera]|nr:hypothetical protein [Candidatus Methylomirabilis oxyfera]